MSYEKKERIVNVQTMTETDHLQGGQLLTIREVAKKLRCSERTVWSWTKTGELPVICLGRSRRYREEDVQAFIIKHRSTEVARENT